MYSQLQLLEKQVPQVFKDPLQEMGGRLWRNREASCNALSDLLQGRRWPELKPKLSDIWTMVLRAVDDIKESVSSSCSCAGQDSQESDSEAV